MWESHHKKRMSAEVHHKKRVSAFEQWCLRRLLRVPWTPRRPTSPSWRKLVLNIHWKDWCWSWSSDTLATWWEELTYWKRPWCWERLRAGEEGGDRGQDGWMASLINGYEFEQALGDSCEGQGSWCATDHGLAKSQTWLNDWTAVTTDTF